MKQIKKVIADYKLLLDNVPALVTSIFIVITILMNFAAAKLLVNIGSFAVTGGFLASFVPFLCMDCVTKRFGARASIMLNILSALGNLFAVIFLSIVAAIPTADPYPEFDYIFGGVWFICLSSTVAFVVSGVINSLLNAAIGKLFKNKTSGVEFAARSFISTFVGQAIDNFLFIAGVYIVFAPIFWGLEPISIVACLGTAVFGGLLELALEIAFGWVGFRICKRWERDKIGQAYLDAHSKDIIKET